MAQTVTSKRLIFNTLSNMVTLASNAIVGFLLIRFFLGRLGEARYGIWVLIGSVFQYRGILTMGLNSSVNRYIPLYLVKKDNKGIAKVVSTSFFYYTLISIVLVLITFVVYFNIGKWFQIDPLLVDKAGKLVLVVGLCSAVSMPLQLANAILSGLQRYVLLNVAILVPFFIRTVLLIVLLNSGYGLLTMGIVFGSSEIVMKLVQYYMAKRLMPELRISIKNVDLSLFKELFAYGANTILYTTGAMIFCKANDVIIGMFVGTEEVAQFATAIAAALLLTQLLQAFSAAIKPAVSDLDARDEDVKIRQIAFLMQKYSLIMIIPACVFFLVMGREFLNLWIGDRFGDSGVIDSMYYIMMILTVAHSIRLSQHSNFLVLVGLGKHRIFGVLTIITAVLCVMFSVIVLKVFNAGLIAVAWSNFIPITLLSGIFLQIYFNVKMKISFYEGVRQIVRPSILAVLPGVIIIAVWQQIRPPQTWLQILAVILLVTAGTLIGTILFGLTDFEKKRYFRRGS